MTTSVVPWASRYRAAWPFAMSIISLVVFLSGMAKRDIRADPTLRPFVWGAPVATGAFALLAIALRPIWRRKVVVDEHGVRVGAIDLGPPARVQHGAFDQDGAVRPAQVADTFDGRHTDFVALRGAIGKLIR